MEHRIWTFEEALKVFPRIKKITESFYNKTIFISDELSENIFPENVQEEKEDEIKDLILEWSDVIREFGAEVKGLWLVDFDNGKGYYCWKLGEKELMYEHSYEAGFKGRKLIKRKKE
ncbi:MAG: DUF2203 family protein [Leptospiraceae bacterium]|nr:DUF2203 family protein [Leptospiraceae bacterium]